jgi:hypothetical protein
VSRSWISAVCFDPDLSNSTLSLIFRGDFRNLSLKCEHARVDGISFLKLSYDENGSPRQGSVARLGCHFPERKADMSIESSTSSDLAEVSQQILAFFADHLVSLAGSYIAIDEAGKETGERRFFAYSGFVISLNGVWHLVTAGHCIEDLVNPVRRKKIRLTGLVLADFFGSAPRVRMSTPFHLEAEDVICFHRPEEGLDFALVALREWFRMGLEANGIRALPEEHWGTADPSAYDFFSILGFPTCLVSDPTVLVPHGDGVAGIVSPTMVWVDRVDNPIEGLPPVTFPWFVGRVKCKADLTSIVGMSGGPILGFRKGADGNLRCSLVAVQSRWWEQSRVTLGCALPDILRAVNRLRSSGERR